MEWKALDMSNSTTESSTETSLSSTKPTLPDYVTGAVTEAGWTWFSSFILIFILFMAATLKYWKKTFKKPKFVAKGREMHLQRVMADDKGHTKSAIRQKPILVAEFQQCFEQRRKYSKTVDKMEFYMAIENTKSADAGVLSVHKAKENAQSNHSAWSVPYDQNRVQLRNSALDSDYINASYVTNYKGEVEWIAAQGPMEKAVVQFWHMVWQENSRSIIMLTKTFEVISLLCVQYWPRIVKASQDFGEYSVSLVEEESYAGYCVRTLEISKGSESRTLKQYHFFAWNLYSDPPSGTILQFRRRIRDEYEKLQKANKSKLNEGPVVVHCHDGSSRTGSYLAILDNLNMADERGEVDVHGTVRRFLRERRSLVSSPEQLTYIYQVIHDRLLCGDTFIATKDLLPALQKKSKKSAEDGMNEYKREHGILSELVPNFTIGDCAAGHRAENRSKNRNTLIVPPDKHRPYLTSFLGNDVTNYINAVYVDGFRTEEEYICAEWPMSKTMISFWSLVYDCDIKTIIVLNNNKGSVNVGNFPSFWPSQNTKSKNFGQVFTVEQVSSTNVDDKFSFWELRLIKQDISYATSVAEVAEKSKIELPHLSNLFGKMRSPSRPVRLFQMDCWPNSQKVPNSTFALVNLINEVEKWRNNSGSNQVHREKVIVVSNDGYSRCGVYCAASATLEQVYHDQEVDVFQAVKSARKNRPQLVANTTEYKYCYDVILHYVLHFCRPTQ